MVCVSGGRVRSLREEQNLTQLYLATAVGVTTETISRWERQEAPTIKEENGVKLATVLSVPLEELLFLSDSTPVPASKRETPGAGNTEPVPAESTGKDGSPKTASLRPAKIVARILVAALVLSSVLLFLFVARKSASVTELTAIRNMPAHSVSGQPFPVVVEVSFATDRKSSFLLTEQVASGCRVLKTVPPATVMEGGLLKWIDKNGPGTSTFSYIASCDSEEVSKAHVFSGSLLVRQARRQEVVIDGRSHLQLLPFHWADSDKNGIIDDEELLAVYDDFGRVPGLGADVEEVEALWMGSGYHWDPTGAVFEITP